MKEPLARFVFFLIVAPLAVVCLAFPKWVQKIAIRAVDATPGALKSFVSTPSIWTVRMVGLIAALMVALLAAASLQ